MRRPLALALTMLVGASIAPVSAATAAPGSGTRATVVVSLKPTSAVTASTVASLADASQPTRRATLAKARPAKARADKVTTWARTQGLKVTYRSDWTVAVSGDAAKLARAFGTTVSGKGKSLRRNGKLKPPAQIAGEVTRAIGLDNRPVFSSQAVRAGGWLPNDLRAAYLQPAGRGGEGVGVGTLQLSPWNEYDTYNYGQRFGITPIMQTISVDGSNVVSYGSSQGEVEVALDTQAILATAPKAQQYVYIAENTFYGMALVLDRMASDAEQGTLDVASSSWGLCEAYMYDQDYKWDDVHFFNEKIDRMVAGGATFFAASGDNGAYGCSMSNNVNNTLSPIYPASSPNTVAVGGTALNKTSTGVWYETAWGEPVSYSNGFKGWGSGGGWSVHARPAYQTGVHTATKRSVPDVSHLADSRTGMAVYVSAEGGWFPVGGTSLAAPLWAGQLATRLSDAGRTEGIGSIHTKLYGNPQAFRDITSGSSLYYSAARGFDRATGLGSPLWSRLGPVLVSSVASRVEIDRVLRSVPVGATYPSTTGRVVDAAGKGVPRVQVRISVPSAPASPSARFAFNRTWAFTTTGADGRFTIPAMKANTVQGSWQLTVDVTHMEGRTRHFGERILLDYANTEDITPTPDPPAEQPTQP